MKVIRSYGFRGGVVKLRYNPYTGAYYGYLGENKKFTVYSRQNALKRIKDLREQLLPPSP